MKTVKDKALSHHKTLIEAFLLGRVPREEILRELGPEQLAEIELQRDALRHDVEWGLRGTGAISCEYDQAARLC